MGAARSGWSMLHQSAFLLALRNASPGTECASRTSVPHFLVDRPFAVVWLYFSWLPRWRDSWLTVWSPVHGPREPTSGYVKLLLPPRQSRGNSLVGLGSSRRSTKRPRHKWA